MTFMPTRRAVIAGASAAMAFRSVAASAYASPSRHPGAAKASQLSRQLFGSRQAPALSLAVARTDRLVWAEALGRVDVEFGVAATPRHTFRLGSVSKVVTATAAARLVARGMLDLDAPISRWLQDLPELHRATTMRQLLTHRGGVRHYGPKDFDVNGPGGPMYMRTYPTDQDILALFINDPLVAPPGTRISYSSYGYTLASMVMQAVTGKEFRQLIHEEIGTPFGLSTLVDDDPWMIQPLRARGYLNAQDLQLLSGSVPKGAWPKLTDGLANIPLSNPAYCWAGAGFLMSPSDTARFGAAVLEGAGTKITAEERKLLFTPMTERTPQMPPLGLGWRLSPDPKGRPRYHHEGATPGGRYALTVYPEQGLSIAIAGNVMNMMLNVGKISSDLADLFA